VIHIDDEEGVAVQLRMLYERMESRRREQEALRLSSDTPAMGFDDMVEYVLHEGIARMQLGRGPNTVFALNPTAPRDHEYRKGDIIDLNYNMHIGAEIMLMEASKRDGPNWDVLDLTFGTLHITGSSWGADTVPLSSVRYLTRWDLLSPFLHMKTKVDVQVRARLQCRTDGATFSGWRVYAFLEEVVGQIQTRIEPAVVPCHHPEEDVQEIKYVSNVLSNMYRSGVSGGGMPFVGGMLVSPGHVVWPASMLPPKPPKRYFCRRCEQEVRPL
jgi:hypothetical protein